MRTTIALLFLVLASLSASAQTAEETVLFLIYGGEDGGSRKECEITMSLGGGSSTKCFNHKVTQVSATEWTFTRTDTRDEKRVSVRQINDCLYSINEAGYDVIFDFSAIQEYRPHYNNRGEVRVQIVAKCGFLDFEKASCPSGFRPALGPFSVSVERLERAFSYFQKNFCRGQAF